MLVALVVSGFRTFETGAPTVGSNPRAMLSASRTLLSSGEGGGEEAVKKLRYGDLGSVVVGGGDCRRVGFGSKDVGALSEDEAYV